MDRGGEFYPHWDRLRKEDQPSASFRSFVNFRDLYVAVPEGAGFRLRSPGMGFRASNTEVTTGACSLPTNPSTPTPEVSPEPETLTPEVTPEPETVTPEVTPEPETVTPEVTPEPTPITPEVPQGTDQTLPEEPALSPESKPIIDGETTTTTDPKPEAPIGSTAEPKIAAELPATEPDWHNMTKAEIVDFCSVHFGETLDANKIKSDLAVEASDLWEMATAV